MFHLHSHKKISHSQTRNDTSLKAYSSNFKQINSVRQHKKLRNYRKTQKWKLHKFNNLASLAVVHHEIVKICVRIEAISYAYMYRILNSVCTHDCCSSQEKLFNYSFRWKYYLFKYIYTTTIENDIVDGEKKYI